MCNGESQRVAALHDRAVLVEKVLASRVTYGRWVFSVIGLCFSALGVAAALVFPIVGTEASRTFYTAILLLVLLGLLGTALKQAKAIIAAERGSVFIGALAQRYDAARTARRPRGARSLNSGAPTRAKEASHSDHALGRSSTSP